MNNVEVVGAQYSKARLDFMLISIGLLDKVHVIKYEDRLGRDFDHKEVLLKIGRGASVATNNIKESTVKSEGAKLIGLLSFYEILNAHLREPDPEIGLIVGRIEAAIKRKEDYIDREIENREVRIAGLEAEILAIIATLPSSNDMLNRPSTCNNRMKYEMVTMGIKNRLLSLQANIRRKEISKRLNLVQDRNQAELDFGINSEEFIIANDALLNYDDNKLKYNTGLYREFFNSNNEKPTAAYCRLGKGPNLEDDLCKIKGNNGEAFRNSEERTRHISNFYSNLYKKRLDRLLSIEDFLTANVARGREVDRKKLNEVEKAELEREVTSEELKKSLDKSNMSSSSGWDGIGYNVIKKYWGDINGLMTLMTNESFREGQLTETFRLGLVKLIPKKGNDERVENWRPITLLSCGYKVISGVVANRLEMHLGKIIGRAQKGFLRHKNINTVGLNILSNINRSWDRGEELGVLCVDFNKAFDSVEHSCITEVLKFFNFGENFIGMVSTILRDRIARVKVENGLSEPFKIERSTPQGDRASPYIFILVIEILIIKLVAESGQGIEMCRSMQDLAWQSGIEIGIAEAYADDLTIMFKMSEDNLNKVLGILNEYEKVSGLSINKNKTQLMTCGNDVIAVGTVISDITVVNEVNVLGIKIDRKCENLNQNWEKVLAKITRLCNYWTMFRLSITGRVMIVKTFLLSQCIYFMNVLNLPAEIGNRINEAMVNFVGGGDRLLARDRWFKMAELGGYGLIDVNALDISIKASWISRWERETDWRDYPSFYATGTNVGDIEQLGHIGIFIPDIIRDIMGKWDSFLKIYYAYEGNILEAPLFENRALSTDDRTNSINGIFSGERWRLILNN